MKTRNTGIVWILILVLMFLWILSTTESHSPSTNSQEAINILPTNEQGVTTETWRLETFHDKETTGLPYDQGEFVNDLTQERVWAMCLEPDASDPKIGDVYVRSGKYLKPVSGAAQSFQVFEIAQTATPPTVDLTETPSTQTTQEVLPTRQTKRSNLVNQLCGIGAIVILFVLIMLGNRFLDRFSR